MEQPPANPVFVFEDGGLMVFTSIDEVGPYYEYMETICAFDKDGNVTSVPPVPGAKPAVLPGNRDNFFRNLRHHMLRFAIARPDLLNKWVVKHASYDQLIDLAIRWMLYRQPSRTCTSAYTVAVLAISAAVCICCIVKIYNRGFSVITATIGLVAAYIACGPICALYDEVHGYFLSKGASRVSENRNT